MILLAHAELAGLICSGSSRRRRAHVRADGERVPTPRRLDRTEALAELALRYFTGHGPATERDLAYWATLTLTDVRAGLQQVRDRLDSFQHDGRTFWHAPGDAPGGPQEPAGHLLQILDETYRGYQDSRWVLDAAGDVPRGRETAIGMALVDAQLVAAMRRTIARDQVQFDLRPYRALTPAQIEALDQAARRYGEYLRLEARLAVTPSVREESVDRGRDDGRIGDVPLAGERPAHRVRDVPGNRVRRPREERVSLAGRDQRRSVTVARRSAGGGPYRAASWASVGASAPSPGQYGDRRAAPMSGLGRTGQPHEHRDRIAPPAGSRGPRRGCAPVLVVAGRGSSGPGRTGTS